MLPAVGTTPDKFGICDAARKRRLNRISFADFQFPLTEEWFYEREEEKCSDIRN